MKPDEDTKLIEMGIGEETCEKCLMELYPGISDTVCDTCKLNPMKHGDADTFIKKVIERENGMGIHELESRFNIMNQDKT